MKQELDTLIRLLYGVPRVTREYLESIPPQVLRKTAQDFLFIESDDTDEYIINCAMYTLIRNEQDGLLPQPSGHWSQHFYKSLDENLREYHDAGT